MKQIDEKILNYCGIYNRPEVDKKTREEVLNKKKEIEKLTGIKIERVYLYGESYWGKNPKRKFYEICFLSDVRISVLKEANYKVREYTFHSDRNILYWSLGQFEKRCQCTRELDYYISKYGALIYDSGKQTEIDESVTTQYAGTVSYFKDFTKRYVDFDENGILMNRLLEIYLLKIGYYLPEKYENIIEYVEYVNEDEKVKVIIEEYKNVIDVQEKTRICHKFEVYIKENVKEYMKLYKLKELPTMQVYEKLEKKFKENGPLDIKTLTKDDLYVMYVIQAKDTYEIAKLFNVSNIEITNKRTNWNIKIQEEILNVKNMTDLLKRTTKDFDKNLIYEVFRKTSLFCFEECIIPILKFMRTEEPFLLKEFWKLTEFQNNNFEYPIISGNITTWYRATLCLEFLKDNGLVEEIEFKKYRITKKGKEIIREYERYHYIYKDKSIMEFLIRSLEKINMFGVIYENESEFIYIEENKNLKSDKEMVLETEEVIDEEKKIKKDEIDIEEQINNIKEIRYVKREKKKGSKLKISRSIKRDYVKEAKSKTEFGRKCENIIYEKEKRDLIKQGRSDLANKVEWVSEQPDGDGKGYDIISYRKINDVFEKIYIEVKGTNKDYDEEFEISTLEVETSEKYGEKYYICRVAKANTKYPIYYEQKGSIKENYDLKPTTYIAIKKYKQYF